MVGSFVMFGCEVPETRQHRVIGVIRYTVICMIYDMSDIHIRDPGIYDMSVVGFFMIYDGLTVTAKTITRSR